MSVPRDRIVSVANVDRVPLPAADRAAAVEIAISLGNDRAGCGCNDDDLVVIHLVPAEGPREDIDAFVVVARA